jgi:hypothetical protein
VEARCRISTGSKPGHMSQVIPSLRPTSPILRFLSDSKALSNPSKLPVSPQSYPVRSLFVIGPERAITEMPMTFSSFHADAARREL